MNNYSDERIEEMMYGEIPEDYPEE